MKATLRIIALGLVSLSLVACGGSEKKDSPEQTSLKPDIIDTAVQTEQLSTLVTAIKEAGLVEVLKKDGPFTVFAPTNDAFDKLPAGALDDLLKDKEKLKKVLTYHVVNGRQLAKDVVGMDGQKVATLDGAEVLISVKDGAVMVNGATVTKTDVECSNGVVHFIDNVIMPK